MQIKVTFKQFSMTEEQRQVTNKFIYFLQECFPLEENVQIVFSGVRYGRMTTGSRTNDSILKILSSDRLLIDILRTLAHEWVHEYQYQILEWDQTGDIGGRNENHANIEAGIIMKKFQKKNKEFEKTLYNGMLSDTDINFS